MPRGSPWLLALSVLLVAPTATGTESVSATVIAKCTVGASSMAFGAYDPLVANKTTALDANGSLSVSCTRGAPGVYVTLDTGANGSHASGTTRAMASGSNYLSYELYTTSARTLVWNATNTVSYTGITSMASATLTVYGQIPAGQDVAASSSYSDSVTATVNF
jgi:spore coat protein U-like protein